jgi:hypothetical protein
VGIIPAASPYQALAAEAPLERAMSALESVDCRERFSFPVPSDPQKLDRLGPIAAVLWQIGPRFDGFSWSGCRSPERYEVGGRLLPAPMDLPDYQRSSAAGESLHNLPTNSRRGAMWKIVPLLVLVAVSEAAVAISFEPMGSPQFTNLSSYIGSSRWLIKEIKERPSGRRVFPGRFPRRGFPVRNDRCHTIRPWPPDCRAGTLPPRPEEKRDRSYPRPPRLAGDKYERILGTSDRDRDCSYNRR